LNKLSVKLLFILKRQARKQASKHMNDLHLYMNAKQRSLMA